jgi:hypothetical protein
MAWIAPIERGGMACRNVKEDILRCRIGIYSHSIECTILPTMWASSLFITTFSINRQADGNLLGTGGKQVDKYARDCEGIGH